jgi:PQQ-dependent catabolism-associated CXXCW motif protein
MKPARMLIVPVWLAFCGVPALAGVPEPSGYRMDDYNAPVPESVAGGRTLHTPELKMFIEQRKPPLIDVLPAPKRPAGMAATAPWMPLPHRDIPGSVWLPDVGRGAISDAMATAFAAQLLRLADGDRTHPIVIYCRARCWMSWNAAKRAAALGFTDVIWYPDGADGWEAAGFPVAVATPIELQH